jgi:hypothetical protein
MKKTVANIIYVIFFGAFFLLFLYKMYAKNNVSAGSIETINYLMGGCILVALFARASIRFFPKWYNEKSSDEEGSK